MHRLQNLTNCTTLPQFEIFATNYYKYINLTLLRQIDILAIVANFIPELRWLAKYCNFSSMLDQMLRDWILYVIEDEVIHWKLQAENKLILTRAMEIMLAMEAAKRNAKEM